MTTSMRTRATAVLWAACADVAAVLVFAVSGRSSHAEALDVAGIAETAWPFLLALVIAWLATLAWRAPIALPLPAVPLWLLVLALGMVLRAASGQGIATPFVLVATGALAVLLLGWRAVVLLVVRARARR